MSAFGVTFPATRHPRADCRVQIEPGRLPASPEPCGSMSDLQNGYLYASLCQLFDEQRVIDEQLLPASGCFYVKGLTVS